MGDNPAARIEAARPRRVSAAGETGASNTSLQDGEVILIPTPRDGHPAPDRLGAAAGRMERRNSGPATVHQRHMPKEPLRFHIPRKTKEKRALFQDVSTESREYEELMNILTSSYIETSSGGSFTYSKPRLVHSELLEKEFVEKRKEMKADGRTDKELEESYCFLLTDTMKLPSLCEKGLLVGHSRITVLGNPTKGVYLSRYSDLLQLNPIPPGFTGELLIFKVMKGKVKSCYENMKNPIDPTPRFDSHISKNTSKVTSINSYRAVDLTQQYFYEYSFDELRERPRQVCPYAVVSFQFKGKDPLPSKPLPPVRLNSQTEKGVAERSQFTVWTGELVKGDRVLYQISLRSFSPPILPQKLPEKLDIGWVMRFDRLTKLLPPELFSYNLYDGSREVMKSGRCCSLLEVIDRNRSTTSVTRLLHELEIKRLVLLIPLPGRGFLFLLSSVQMATPIERGESWKRSLQALFVLPESRHQAGSTSRCSYSMLDASQSSMSAGAVMPRMNQFIPALHHALVKARANPPPELSAGVERQARDYLIGINVNKVRRYPMGQYESVLDDQGKLFPAPKHHRVNMDSYLRSYLYSPHLYLLSVARARQMVEAHCGPEELQEDRLGKSQSEAMGRETKSHNKGGQTNTQKMQQLIDLVLTCKRNAENEVTREEVVRAGGVGEGGGAKAQGRKRRLEQQTAERALKYLKASQEHERHDKIPVEGTQVSASPGSLASVIGSVGLKDIDLREDGSELASRLLSLLTGLNQAARGLSNQSVCTVQEGHQRESSPFDRLATKLGLPTNCDIDLRRQEELEDQTAGSVSSLEGFSPSSHSGEMNHHGAGRGGRHGRRAGGYEEDEEEGQIPWVLIPITGLCSERYTQTDRNIPQDPRFQHLATTTSITMPTKPPRKSPTTSPGPSPPPSPLQCPSPVPSPPNSPILCPSPDPSPPPSPSQCPSPEPSPPPSPSQCPSPEPSPPPSPAQCLPPQHSQPTPLSQKPNEPHLSNRDPRGVNKEQLAQMASRESAAVSKDIEKKPQGEKRKAEEPSIPPSAPESSTDPSPPGTVVEVQVKEEEKEGTPPEENVRTLGGKEAAAEKEVEIKHVVPCVKEEKSEVKELVPGSPSPRPVSATSSHLLGDIENIVDNHLGNFSSQVQLLLQEENINYTFPQSPHSTSYAETPALQTLQYTPISQFSKYVSFNNPCPLVQDYVTSLHNSISSMLTQFDDSWPSHKATGRTNADAALANTVSAFVSSIRAGNEKTDRDDDDLCGEGTAAEGEASVGGSPAPSRGGEVWQLHKHFPDAKNSPSPSHATLSISTSGSGSACKPTSTTVHIPPPLSPDPHWKPQPGRTVVINRKVTCNPRQTADDCDTRTVYFASSEDSEKGLLGTDRAGSLQGFGGVPENLTEPSLPPEPVSVSVAGHSTNPTPPATALSSLISRLQPEVFNSLVEIIKDVKKNSLQFYLHSTEPKDQVYEDVKEQLLKQGNLEMNPVDFLNQENPDNRLLVIIKNKDIAGHIHKIPGLVSLKRHSSVVFMGIDTLDDIRNNSYNELFISGGCIVSDELVLNPDFIAQDRLASLLMFMEQHSSPETVWRWKIHCKTHKRLKEQARFRRDAANLLDILSVYHKRQIVEFLPYHHCDMMNQSPDLRCLLELQARYTQFRHTVFMTAQQFETFPDLTSSGIIVTSFKEISCNFNRVVGYHGIKEKQLLMDEIMPTKGLGPCLSLSESVSGSERSPPIFPEQIHPLPSHNQAQAFLQQSSSSLPPLSHLSDQLVPDASCKEALPQHSGTEYEALRQAISTLRAERLTQQQQQQHQQRLDSQEELSLDSLRSVPPNPAQTGSRHSTPPSGRGGSTDVPEMGFGKNALAAALGAIHSTMQLEAGEETRGEDRAQVGLLEVRRDHSDTSSPLSNHNAATVTGTNKQSDSAGDPRQKEDQQAESVPSKGSSSTTACPADGRDTQSVQEQHTREKETSLDNTSVGSITVPKDQKECPNPALPRHQQLLQQSLSHLQPVPQSQRQGVLLQPPRLPLHPNQPFSHGPLLAPMTSFGAMRGILPTPLWPGGLGPTNAAALVWGFQQPGRDFTGPRLLGGYHNLAGQGNNQYRGGPRGGGFNGI